MRTLLIITFGFCLFGGLAHAGEHFSSNRCEQVRQSVITDLPYFCHAEKIDKVRLVDFSSQLDVLEKNCKQPALAAELKLALGEKVHLHDSDACMATAQEMVQVKKNASAAKQRDSSF